MVNYELAKIYKIVDNTNGNIYIGSTCEPTLARRLATHKGSFKQYLNGTYHYIKSFEILKNENYDIFLLEKCKCITSKDELHARERYYIENNECLNKVIPTRTLKEWRENNKDALRQYQKQYYADNNEHYKQWRENNKDATREYSKQYYEENKAKIREYQKQYYEKNKLKKLNNII
jgi:hypothetical protein